MLQVSDSCERPALTFVKFGRSFSGPQINKGPDQQAPWLALNKDII
jgi:hypothetical protein